MTDTSTLAAIGRAGPRLDPPEPRVWTCANQSEHHIYLTGTTAVLGADDLAAILADPDGLAWGLEGMLLQKGAVHLLGWARCPMRGKRFRDEDFASAWGDRCGTCGGPLEEWRPTP